MNLKSKFVELSTHRLLLRSPNPSDVDQFYLLRTNEDVNEYLDRKIPNNKKEVEELIQKLTKGNQKNQWFYWVISEIEEMNLMGTICLWNFNAEYSEAEIGFELLPSHQGKGYMSEALERVLKFGLNILKLKRISGWTHPQNSKSIRLMNRLGMGYERLDQDHVIYTIREDS